MPKLTNRFGRALAFNTGRFSRFVPSPLFRLTRTPRFGARARNLLFALDFLRAHAADGRAHLEQVAEFGVARGEGLRQLYILTRHYCAYYGLQPPSVYGFDSFEGLQPSEHPADVGTWAAGDYPSDYEALVSFAAEAGWTDLHVVKGYFSDSLASIGEDFAPTLLLIDCDYYTSTRDVFEALKNRLETPTVVYFDDLGTNFYNRNMGEERLIHEVNSGDLGEPYHLHPLWGSCYVWSNAEKPVRKQRTGTLDIPLKRSTALENLY